jgi:hypothetical protein
MGCLREAGFSFDTEIHAYSVQDAYIHGFALQEQTLGFERPEDAGAAVQRRAEAIGALDEYPYLAEIATRLPSPGTTRRRVRLGPRPRPRRPRPASRRGHLDGGMVARRTPTR